MARAVGIKANPLEIRSIINDCKLDHSVEINLIYIYGICKVSLSVSVYEIFAMKMHMIFILTFKMAEVKCKYVQSIYMSSHLMAMVTFPLPFTISDIFVNQINSQQFDPENEGPCERGEKRDLHQATGNVPFHIRVSSEFELHGNIHL